MAGPSIAVVGAGVTGLAAALRIRDRLPAAEVTVYEQGPVAGGKLRTGWLAGAPVELGAEVFLARDLEGGPSTAVALCHRLGLGDALVHPEPVPPAIVVDGTLRPLPARTLLGVPSDLSTLDGVAVADGERDRPTGGPLLAPGADVTVGALVRGRLGDQVVDRLVDPMLGGVYAGRADDLSLRVTMPGLALAAERESTVVGAARAAMAASAAHRGGPVFATVHGGVSRLVEALIAALDPGAPPGPGTLRCGAPVRELRPAPGGGWHLVAGEGERHPVDGVVFAVRPDRLLGSGPLVDYASIGLVCLALPAVDLPAISGFLVPAGEGRAVKAVTFFTSKWAHQRRPDGTVLLRASLGRYGETGVLHRTDEDLVTLVRAELADLLGRALPEPTEALVARWGGALPQYRPGHLDRLASLRAGLPPRLVLAGAAYDGVGIPACVRSATVAADRLVEEFRT